MISPRVSDVLHIATRMAQERRHGVVAPGHLLLALLNPTVGFMDTLIGLGKDVGYMADWADIRLAEQPPARSMDGEPKPDAALLRVLQEADLAAMRLSRLETDEVALMAALATPGVGFSYDQLKSFPLRAEEMAGLPGMAEQQAAAAANAAVSPNGSPAGGGTKGGALGKYTQDKTAMAQNGKLDPIIGRDKEVRQMAEIVSRRLKPNVLIVGEPGVGKTALVDGFAQLIAQGLVPEALKGARLLELDFGTLVAGASYKGEVEDRLKSIITEVKAAGVKTVLFIDELHQLLDKQGGNAGAAQILKPELARGEITLIGATTQEEYRKHIERDEAFARRFELLTVEEPDLATATRMAQAVAPLYEKHHDLPVAPDALPEAVRLAKRYAKDRRLPDAALDLLDRTMASVRLLKTTAAGTVEQLSAQLDALEARKPAASADEQAQADFAKEVAYYLVDLRQKVSPVLLAPAESSLEAPAMDDLEANLAYARGLVKALKDGAEQLTKLERLEAADLVAVISAKTGIPLGKIQKSEQGRLLGMEDILRARVVGQDLAVHTIAEAILESRSGLNKPGQPIGSFFLLGPTGTGKTELAKSLAEFLFQDESAMIRFDMSEFKEEHSAALLYGAPPGYVGYEEGGLLVNKIRQQPYAIVLFDEIEKAHPSVFDLFLQIMDEGKLHDRMGKLGDFSNAVVLFTSNIGAETVAEKLSKGEKMTQAELLALMQRNFRPEFLARLTEIAPFAPLSNDMALRIFGLQVKALATLLGKQGISLELTPEASKLLALTGFDPRYGARPLAGVVRAQLRRPLSRAIVSGQLVMGDTALVSTQGNKLVWQARNADGEVRPLDLPVQYVGGDGPTQASNRADTAQTVKADTKNDNQPKEIDPEINALEGLPSLEDALNDGLKLDPSIMDGV